MKKHITFVSKKLGKLSLGQKIVNGYQTVIKGNEITIGISIGYVAMAVLLLAANHFNVTPDMGDTPVHASADIVESR